MEDLKKIVGENIITLRTGAGMTQAELAEKLNYSDKSVSKWERAEGLPDAYVLKQMGEIFGVSVDRILTAEPLSSCTGCREDAVPLRTEMITAVVIIGIWTLSLLVFVVCWLQGLLVWLPFVYALPLSLIALLVFHSVWEGGWRNAWIVGALIPALLLSVYFTFYQQNWWQLFLLAIPAELIVFLSFRIHRPRV